MAPHYNHLNVLLFFTKIVTMAPHYNYLTDLDLDTGPVVQSIISLTSSFIGQLDKCFTTS